MSWSAFARSTFAVGVALVLAACALGQSPDLPSVGGDNDTGGTPTGNATGGLPIGGGTGGSASGGGPNCWTVLVEGPGGLGGLGGDGGGSSGDTDGATLTTEICE